MQKGRENAMKKEYFTIPNLMGYFRILMLPVFLYLYHHAETQAQYWAAFVVLGISMLTDFFDGKIARRFNMVTDFGKALDPVADKLTQGALAIAVSFHYPLMKVFVAFFVAKECYMAVIGLYLIKKKNSWTAAKWYGKICTGIVDIGIFVLLLFPEIPVQAGNALILLMMAAMLFSLVKYIQFHLTVLRKDPSEKRKREAVSDSGIVV